MSGGLNCDECRETFERDDENPPCEDCGKPQFSHPANTLPWKVWRMCSAYERPAGMGGINPIPVTSVISVVEAYGGNERDIDKVLRIEGEMLPVIRENIKNQRGN